MLARLFRKRRAKDDISRFGRWGEKRSEKMLKSKGLKILTRNFSCKTGEVDLIMVNNDGTIVFVEVKTRADDDFQPLEALITNAKKMRLIRAANHFLSVHRIQDRPCRFDVVTVVSAGRGREKIAHYENAFVP